MTAFCGFDNLTLNVSFPSVAVSPTTGTSTVSVRPPKVTVPLAAMKSEPAWAVTSSAT
jgi:hypothetical protein